MLEFLLSRRSVKAELLEEPGPDARQLEQILTAAARVPDHKKLVPWRFILFAGEARKAFGERLADICAHEEAIAPSGTRLELERNRFLQAPLVVALIFSRNDTKPVPEIEQLMSCGAAGMNLCLAANALGFGSQWVTEWCAYSSGVATTLGLESHERIAGFIHIGTSSTRLTDRDRPVLGDIVSHWQP